MHKLKTHRKYKTLDKLRAMGMTLGPEYSVLANTLEASRKTDADNAKITKIEYKPSAKKEVGFEYFIVKITLSENQTINIVEVEIDGRTFTAHKKGTTFEQNAYYAEDVKVGVSLVSDIYWSTPKPKCSYWINIHSDSIKFEDDNIIADIGGQWIPNNDKLTINHETEFTHAQAGKMFLEALDNYVLNTSDFLFDNIRTYLN